MNDDPSPAYVAALERLLASPTLPKLGLLRMEALCAALGDPQRRVPVLHIAGTKGKGSTSAMTASILRAAGLRVGLTTSPHLLSARERIVTDDDVIHEDRFVALEARIDAAARTLPASLEVPSFFERLCAMAFCAFADAAKEGRLDVVVVEVGLGGRLDATNVVRPVAAAITRLGLDHTEFLGPTLGHIAAEKAGIIKASCPVVSAPQDPLALAVIVEAAARHGASLHVVDDDDEAHTPPTALAGRHQRENAAVARLLVQKSGLITNEALTPAVVAGLERVRWPGRYETVSLAPLVILDGAHDGLAASVLCRAILEDRRITGPLVVVVGCSTGHAPEEILAPFRALTHLKVVATAAQHPRAYGTAIVERACREVGLGVVKVVDGVAEAVAAAMAWAREDRGAVVVTGSLFVVGEARACFERMPRDPAWPRY